MSFLRRLFSQKSDPLIEKAGNLVEAAHVNAVGMFVPVLDRYPSLREVEVEHWDFILTVASVFMAATRLNNLHLGDAREERLMDLVTERLNKWKPDGLQGFDDCKRLFEAEFDRLTTAGHEVQFVAVDAIGTWITLNVLGRAPQTNDESSLVRTTGTMITHTFFDWWDS